MLAGCPWRVLPRASKVLGKVLVDFQVPEGPGGPWGWNPSTTASNSPARTF